MWVRKRHLWRKMFSKYFGFSFQKEENQESLYALSLFIQFWNDLNWQRKFKWWNGGKVTLIKILVGHDLFSKIVFKFNLNLNSMESLHKEHSELKSMWILNNIKNTKKNKKNLCVKIKYFKIYVGSFDLDAFSLLLGRFDLYVSSPKNTQRKIIFQFPKREKNSWKIRKKIP